MAEPNTRLSEVKQELSVFKSEFSSFFEKLKENKNVKFSDINAQLHKIKKKKKKHKKISYRGSEREHNH